MSHRDNGGGIPWQGIIGGLISIVGSVLLGNSGFFSSQNISNAPRVFNNNGYNTPTITIGGNRQGLSILGNGLGYNNQSQYPVLLSNNGFGSRQFGHNNQFGNNTITIDVSGDGNGITIGAGNPSQTYSTTNANYDTNHSCGCPHTHSNTYANSSQLWGGNSLSISLT